MAKCCLERKLIGEILVERGLVTAEALDQALEYQKKLPGVYIGEVLIRLGLLTEIDIVTALVVQCNLPFIAISKHLVDEAVIRLIPAEFAHGHRLIPLDRIGNVLSIVIVSPIGDQLRSEVEQMTGCQIALFISTCSEIETALKRFYPEFPTNTLSARAGSSSVKDV
ncbi:MAG: hypothetical protein HQL22_04545 [Candidatus Omnitrophica bacterium]|nr:hypothetical protein [Candidatus Omnitrophota bacterium]